MQKIKGALATVLAVALMITLPPYTGLAEDTVHPVGDPSQLEEALNSIEDGDTIELTANIDYTYPITIDGINVTFDLKGFVLNVTADYGEAALLVENNGSVTLTDEGELNVTGLGPGVHGAYARDGATASVTNAAANGGSGHGAYADGGAVSVSGNATTENDYSGGAYAVYGGTVTVDGNVTAEGFFSNGAYAGNGGAVIVKGDAKADGYSGVGAYAVGGTVDIGGDATAEGQFAIGASAMDDGAVTVGGDTTAEGDGSNGAYAGNGGTVTVSGGASASGSNCYGAYAVEGTVDIGGDAMADGQCASGATAMDGGTVTVGGSATAEGDGCYGARAYSFDGKSSSVEITVNATTSGINSYGVYAEGENGSVMVEGDASAEGEGSYGAYALNSGSVTVGGNAKAVGNRICGAYAGGGGTVEVGQAASTEGDDSYGAYAAYGSRITVEHDATATGDVNCIGAYAEGGTIEVGGDAAAVGGNSRGAEAVSEGEVTVAGDASAKGANSYGAFAANENSYVEVGQDATGEGSWSMGAAAGENGKVKVCQNAVATGDYSCGASASYGGMVEVDADAASTGAYGCGVDVTSGGIADIHGNIAQSGQLGFGVRIYNGGTVMVGGNVTANGNNGCGADVYGGGTATIEGVVAAPVYARVNNVPKTAANGVRGTTPYQDYLIYSQSSSIIRIRIHLSLTITSTTLPAATAGTAYTRAIAVDYNGSHALTYSATGLPDGLSINTGTGVISGTPAAGTDAGSPYSVKIDVTDGTLNASKTFSLAVNVGTALPVINTQPADTAGSVGGAATFTVGASASDGGSLSYQWQRSTNTGASWSNIMSATGASYTVSGLTLANNGYQYRCTVKNTKNGTSASTNSNAATLTVTPTAVAPVINAQPADAAGSVGGTAAFTVGASASDGGSLSYQWQRSINGGTSWMNVSGATGAGYTTGILAITDNESKYRCVVTNTRNGSTALLNSTAATLTVNHRLSITTALLGDAAVGAAYSLTVETDYTGSGPLTFSATGLPGDLSINAGTGVISGTPVAGTETGSPYSVTVNVTDGSLVDTKSFSLGVRRTNTPPAAKVPAPVQNVASGDSVSFTADDIAQDSDGDPLTITAITAAPDIAVATAVLSNGTVTVTGGSEGSTSLTVKVSDGADTADVTVPVEVAAAPAATYALAVTAGTGGRITVGSSGNYTAGAVIAITAAPSPGYRFKEWTSTGGGTFADARSSNTAFTMPANAATITAGFIHNGSGRSDDRDRDASAPMPAYEAHVSREGAAETTLPVAVDTGAGSAAVELEIPAGDIFHSGSVTVVTVPSVPGVNAYTLGISAASLSGSPEGGSLTFATGAGSITLPGDMLSGIVGVGGQKAGITVGQGDKSGLSEEVRKYIGDRPMVRLTLTLDGKPAVWDNPDAPVAVAMPYPPTAAELADPEHIVVWYIDGAGNAVSVPNGRYDPATGTVTFTATHFSYYAVAYVHKTFDDLANAAWARESVEILASKGVLKGISESEYAPQADITRADFLYFLVRTLGIDAGINGNFDDISGGAYYYKEIGIARKLGITGGTGDNKFSPDACITRQEMMVLTERALGMLKKLKEPGMASDLAGFSDGSLVAEYAVGGVASMVREGLIAGRGGKLDPLENATRAEAAVFLYRVYGRV